MCTSQQESMLPDVQPDLRTREERELDERYSVQLAQYKVINNLRQKLKSLQDLTAMSVANIVTNCVTNNADFNPLDGLPGSIITILQDAMGEHATKKFGFIKFFITERTKELTLNFSENLRASRYGGTPWSLEQITVLLELLNLCQNQLMKLSVTIQNCRVCPSLEQINYIVQRQSNVQELVLSGCSINDETMAIIGSTCLNLSVLCIDNSAVTDKGLQYLCASPEPHGKCTKITNLSMNDTSTTDTGLTVVLCNLPDLDSISCEHLNITEIFVQLCEANSPLILSKFKKIDLDFNIGNSKKIIPKLNNMLPNLEEIKIDTRHIDINQLLMLKGSITKLTLLINKKYINYKALLPKIILKYKDTLTLFEIINLMDTKIVTIDISIFAHCPYLEQLTMLNCHILQKTEYPLLPSSFTKLASLNIPANDTSDVIPDQILIRMLQSRYLLFINKQIYISEYVLKSVVDEVYKDHYVFSKLIFIALNCEYSLDTWIKFLCIIPNKCFQVTILSSEQVLNNTDRAKLISFVSRNNINARFIC